MAVQKVVRGLVPALVLLITGCQALAPFQAPAPAPEPPPRGVLATRAPSGPTTDIAIYLPRWFEDDTLGLRAARRTVSTTDLGRQAIEALIRGPNGDERADDFQYPLSIRTRVLTFAIEDGIARVEFDQELEQVRGRPYSELVYWSIVYTLTEVPGIRGVALLRSGQPLREFGFPPVSLPVTAGRSDAPAWAHPR